MPHPQGDRALVCPSCQYSQYPRINPCVIVAISKDDTILLARAQRFNRPMYSLLAGFVEAGRETLEQAVAREVLEEVGVQLKNIRYFGSQAWPFPSNLMLGFTAEWASGNLFHLPKKKKLWMLSFLGMMLYRGNQPAGDLVISSFTQQ